MVKLLKTNNLSSILILFIVKSYARNNILKNVSYIVQGKCTITTLLLKYKILAACYLTISQEKQKTYKNNLKTNLNGSNISSNMHNLLDKMLDPFKRANFTQHFAKEQKNHVAWCWRKIVSEQLLHETFSCV